MIADLIALVLVVPVICLAVLVLQSVLMDRRYIERQDYREAWRGNYVWQPLMLWGCIVLVFTPLFPIMILLAIFVVVPGFVESFQLHFQWNDANSHESDKRAIPYADFREPSIQAWRKD